MYALQEQSGCVTVSGGAFYRSGAALLHCKQDFLLRRHHEKNTRMNFTKMTSARMTNSEERTTELVAESPTPAVPPCVTIPWKHPIIPMISPKTAVLKVGARKSLKLAPTKP